MAKESLSHPSRVALYARVSTANGQQDPELQLAELREYATRRGWRTSRTDPIFVALATVVIRTKKIGHGLDALIAGVIQAW